MFTLYTQIYIYIYINTCTFYLFFFFTVTVSVFIILEEQKTRTRQAKRVKEILLKRLNGLRQCVILLRAVWLQRVVKVYINRFFT